MLSTVRKQIFRFAGIDQVSRNWPITLINTLLNSADIKTKEKKSALTIQRKKLDRVSSFMKSVKGDLSPDVIIQEDEEEIVKMTAEKIAKKLCGNKDCPAVQKFKEYGTIWLISGLGLSYRGVFKQV